MLSIIFVLYSGLVDLFSWYSRVLKDSLMSLLVRFITCVGVNWVVIVRFFLA
jgi:hypothetical protein